LRFPATAGIRAARWQCRDQHRAEPEPKRRLFIHRGGAATRRNRNKIKNLRALGKRRSCRQGGERIQLGGCLRSRLCSEPLAELDQCRAPDTRGSGFRARFRRCPVSPQRKVCPFGPLVCYLPISGGFCTMESSKQNTTKTASPAATIMCRPSSDISAVQSRGRRCEARNFSGRPCKTPVRA
jgi:hypothetical protein